MATSTDPRDDTLATGRAGGSTTGLEYGLDALETRPRPVRGA